MKKKAGQSITTILAVLTLIVTIVAAVPAFLSLNEEHPEIYYSVSSSAIQIPSTLDANEVKKILLDNGIPQNTLSVSVINQGNGPTDEVKVSIEVPGKIISAWSIPAKADSPIWVELPEIDVTQQPQKIILPIKNMGTTKPLTINIGYVASNKNTENIEVFYDGKPAKQVEDATSIKEWSPWKVFILPLVILVIGILLIMASSFLVVLINDPAQKERLLNLTAEVGKQAIELALQSIIRFPK